MKLKYLFTAITLMCAIAANAIDVTTTEAGTLSAQIGDNKDVTTLKISGPINAADFQYITGTLTRLTSLDLSDATIEAVSSLKTPTGNTEFPANELPEYALFGTKLTSVVLPDNIVTIGEGALGSSAITTVTIPASVTTISNYAFAGCTKLTEITVPSTVKNLGQGLWKGCTALKKATIFTVLLQLGDNMFEGCSSLTNVALQPTFTTIGNSAFAGCSKLDHFDFPSTLVSIGDKAFYQSGLYSVQLNSAKSLASVGDYAFALCSNLEVASIGGDAPVIGKGVFFDDTALHAVQLPASTTVIPAFTFKGTTAMDATYQLPSATQRIEDYALCGWEQMPSLTLPANTEYLGTGAMEGWTSLSKIDAENLSAVPTLGDNVWEGVDQSKVDVTVQSDLAEEFQNADQWKEFKITLGATGSDAIIDDMAGANGSVNVDFNVGNGYIRIESHGEDIASVNIFDLNGRNRYVATNVDSHTFSVNTSQWRGTVLIVNVTLQGGGSAAIKINA